MRLELEHLIDLKTLEIDNLKKIILVNDHEVKKPNIFKRLDIKLANWAKSSTRRTILHRRIVALVLFLIYCGLCTCVYYILPDGRVQRLFIFEIFRISFITIGSIIIIWSLVMFFLLFIQDLSIIPYFFGSKSERDSIKNEKFTSQIEILEKEISVLRKLIIDIS